MTTSRTDAQRFAANVARFRQEAGLTQNDLALALDVSTPSVHRWEAASGMPSSSVLVRIAELFRRPLDDLFAESPPDRGPLAAQVRFKVIGELDGDLRAELEKAVAKINRAQLERVAEAKAKGRKGKKL